MPSFFIHMLAQTHHFNFYFAILIQAETQDLTLYLVKVLGSQLRVPMFKTTGWLQGRLSRSSFRG